MSTVIALTERRGSGVVNGLVASGELREQPVTGYVGYQQTENDLEPVFRDDVIRKLADPSIGAISASEEFAEPVARKRELGERIEPFKSFAKRLLGRK